MPRRSLVHTVRLSQWNTRSWTPLVPGRRFDIMRRLDFARRGLVYRLLGAALAVGIAAVVAGSSRADEPAPAAAPVAATSPAPAAPAAAPQPAASAATPAAAAPTPATRFDRLSVEPASVNLGTAEERVQLVVTAYNSDGSMTDMTHKVEYFPADEKVARVDDGIVIPAGDGGADIEVRALDPADGHQLTVHVPVKVHGYGVVRAVDFANDVEPILSKFGCNAGGCHGKATGQNGFKLSLLGFDAGAGLRRARQARARAAGVSGRPRSLAAADQGDRAVAHGGGKRFEVDSAAYRLLRRWIEQGMPLGKPDSPTVAKIEAVPAERIMQR